MLYLLAANLVMLLHFAFIVFALFGSLAVLRWPTLAWVHLPVVGWGVLVAVMGWVCPLTPLENRLRQAGGQNGYSESFIEHYLAALIYPEGLTRQMQITLGMVLLLVNIGAYAWLYWRSR